MATPSPHIAAGLRNGSREGQLQGEWRGGWGARAPVGEPSLGAGHPVFLSEQSSFSPHSPGAVRPSQQSSVELEQTSSNRYYRGAGRPSGQTSLVPEQTSSNQHYCDVLDQSGASRTERDVVSAVRDHWIQAHRYLHPLERDRRPYPSKGSIFL